MQQCFASVMIPRAILLLLAAVACTQEPTTPTSIPREHAREESASVPILPMAEVGDIKERYEAGLLRIQGVVGVGVGKCRGDGCIKVFVVKKTPELVRAVPSELEGVTVDIEETGEMKGLPSKRE